MEERRQRRRHGDGCRHQDRSTGSNPARLTNVNGTLYFSANDGNGVGLWKSDGTAAGTSLLWDIWTGDTSTYNYNYRLAIDDLTVVNGKLFFAAKDVAHGKELWTSNGTPVGTVMVKDIDPALPMRVPPPW